MLDLVIVASPEVGENCVDGGKMSKSYGPQESSSESEHGDAYRVCRFSTLQHREICLYWNLSSPLSQLSTHSTRQQLD